MKDEKKNAKDNYLNKNSTKNGILSLIAAITHKLGISSIWIIANLATYIISYLKQNDKDNTFLGQTLCYFFNPILTTTLNIFMPICGILEFKLGCQRAIILGGLVIMSGFGLLFISKNIFIDFFCIFLFGIGLSISTTLSTKNAIQYFFNQRGAISGILELISSGLSATHNKIAESMINPNGEEPTPIPGDKGSKDNYYSLELSSNVLNVFLLELGTWGISTLLTLLFLVPYDEKAAKKLSKELKKKAQEKNQENNAINDDENKKDDDKGIIVKDNRTDALLPEDEDGNTKINEYEINNAEQGDYDAKIASGDNKDKKVIAIPDSKAGNLAGNPVSGNLSMSVSAVNYSTRHTKKALGSFRVWKLFTLVLCSYLALNLVLVCWRPIGVRVKIPTETLQFIGTCNFIMSMLGTPFFGFLSDKVPFRILFSIVSAITSVVGFFFCYTFNAPFLFSLMVCGMNFALGGHIAILPAHYMKDFGMKYYVEVGGVVGFSNVIMGPICAFFAYFVENNVSNKIFAYRIIFITGAALNVVTLVLSLFESDDEFDYGF